MDNPGVLIILIAIVLIVMAVVLSRRRKELAEQTGIEIPTRGRRQPPTPDVPADPTVPRPRVVDTTVLGTEAHVTFDVPVPEDGDEVLADVLVQEALEVIREKRHTIPMEMVKDVVVFAGRGDRVQVGRHKLATPGTLPPKVEMPSMLNLSRYARDPLELSAEEAGFEVPDIGTTSRGDELTPIGEEIRLPKAIDTGLRAQGIDPDTMNAVELVTGMLRLLGYEVMAGPRLGTFSAIKGGQRTFISGQTHAEGEYPEVDSELVDKFVTEFSMSGADRGLFVSEKYGPFEMYDKERRDSRLRFVTRERLQQMVDATALS